MNYGTVIDNRLQLAPRAFMLHGAMITNPKAEHFAAKLVIVVEGWKILVNTVN